MNFSWGSERKYIQYNYAKYLPASINSLTQPRRPFAAARCKAVCLVSGSRRSGEIFLSNRAHRRSSSRPSRAVKNSVYLWPMTDDEASLYPLQCMHSIYWKINLLDNRWSLLSITKVIKGGGRVLPYVSHICMFHCKGYGFWALSGWKQVETLPILIWNQIVWFLRELQECMKVFVVSIPNE